MSGTGTPPPLQPPTGAPLAAFVEGLLDGRVGDATALQQAIANLQHAGAGPFRAEVLGGRFSLLPAATQVTGAPFDEAAQARFLQALQGVAAAAAPGSVETNLRCRLVYADVVAETLFVQRNGALEPLTRVRPRTADDGLGVPRAPAVPFGLRRRELLFAAPLLLLAGGLVAWQSGWIDRVLAARAEQLRTDTGPFGAMLQLRVEPAWGNYRVTITRGPEYPATTGALAARRDGTDDLVARAAIAAVGDGGAIFVQLLGPEDKVLAEHRTELRPLLTAVDGTIEAKLPGAMLAASVRLSLSKAPEPK
ncbi:MAG: hypothetical protein ACK501_05010 [Planctomycetota bacterium]